MITNNLSRVKESLVHIRPEFLYRIDPLIKPSDWIKLCPLLCASRANPKEAIMLFIDEQLVLGFLESVPKFVSYLFSFSFQIHLDYRSRTRILKNYVRWLSFKIEIRLKRFKIGTYMRPVTIPHKNNPTVLISKL